MPSKIMICKGEIMMNRMEKIDQLINMPYYMIDLLPKRVQKKNREQFLAIEEYFHKEKQLKKYCGKIVSVLLKLNCYYNFEVGSGNKWKKNPKPEKLEKTVQKCIMGKKDYIHIFVGSRETLVFINGDDLYLSIYNPDKKMQKMLNRLAKAEGLFFRQGDIPENAEEKTSEE